MASTTTVYEAWIDYGNDGDYDDDGCMINYGASKRFKTREEAQAWIDYDEADQVDNGIRVIVVAGTDIEGLEIGGAIA